MTSTEVRSQLVDALRLDLIGPDERLGSAGEVLAEPPSRWYVTGFLIPSEAGEGQRFDQAGTEELEQANDAKGLDDAVAPERAAARRSPFPSSIGLSFFVKNATKKLDIAASWGDYVPEPQGESGTVVNWRRAAKSVTMTLDVPAQTAQPFECDVPGSGGLKIALSVREIATDGKDGGIPKGTRSLSVFLVNRRMPATGIEHPDAKTAFQARIEVACSDTFVPRPNLHGLESLDWDESVADLQYSDACEYGVGHNVSTEVEVKNGACKTIRTTWLPQAEVERVAPTKIAGVELSMDALAMLKDGQDADAKLGRFVAQYREWIAAQKAKVPKSPKKRRETAIELLKRAKDAADRIERGISLLGEKDCLEAFRLANRAMAAAARQRQGVFQGKDPATANPEWRPFQLAFLLMNMQGIADPKNVERGVVDLLFFPTGGGKTEAYLGLAAFTLVLRRLRNPGIASAGLSVLMRYTLRLLTLDQLGRAATLICALELERQQDVEKLGEWPFEIGLWVGKAATPNRMGHVGDNDKESARSKTIAFQGNDSKPSPIPLEKCPWCNEKFARESFNLRPNRDHPTDLRITCVNRRCRFTHDNPLPILAVDEPIYRRLPCFMIATVDKFAAMPWTGEVGGFFGKAHRYDKHGFFGPCNPTAGQPLPAGGLLPPDLIIQDELHLISGPLGTMVGLYETALDDLCTRRTDKTPLRPKIIASTATVRRAETQIRALFNRRQVDIFPPPGPDRRDSFFAEVHPVTKSAARLYVGVAAQGRSPKVIMLKTYLALLGAAQKAFKTGKADPANPADPYMTLLGYFNSLRELGGARRLIEDEVDNRLQGYANRRRVGETSGSFVDRKIATDVVELTSRVNTSKVSEAKRRLELPFSNKERVDVAIATNMISVGLDITRLGLMVVYGQPKTSAEYIQATSRVGRDFEKPGLVVTMLNVHKPRDRSHYERFATYHESFYRSVEATSVTPFSPRALDRGLAGTLVALARLGVGAMTSPRGAGNVSAERETLAFVSKALAERACVTHSDPSSADAEKLRQQVRIRAENLLDEWSKIAKELHDVNAAIQYGSEIGQAKALLHHFLDPELKFLPPRYRKFRANRSLRDVEPSVNLWLKTMDGIELAPEEEDEE